MGTAEGLYAGTGNVGAGVGALLLPRIFGTDYQSVFLWLGVIALLVAAWYLVRGSAAKTTERRDAARRGGDLRGMVFVWTRDIAIALMLAYAMSFGLEIALTPRSFHDEIATLGFTGVAGLQIAAGSFAAVELFNASLFRPLAGFMSDLFQRRLQAPRRFRSSPRNCPTRRGCTGSAIFALILITVSMAGLTDRWALRLIAAVGRDAGGARHLHLVLRWRHLRSVSLAFPDRPGIAAGFVGGISTFGGIAYPLIFAGSANTHVGYLYVALYMFVPFILFYFWAARYERRPQEHGFLSRSPRRPAGVKLHTHEFCP